MNGSRGLRRITSWILVIALGLSMAGCSGGDGNSVDTPDTPGSSPVPQSVTVSWTAPTLNTDGTALTDLSGYIVFYGTASRIYAGSLKISDPGITSASVEGLPSGRWYFSLKSVNAAGVESDFSAEVQADI